MFFVFFLFFIAPLSFPPMYDHRGPQPSDKESVPLQQDKQTSEGLFIFLITDKFGFISLLI